MGAFQIRKHENFLAWRILHIFSVYWVTLFNLNYDVPVEKNEKVAIGNEKVAIENEKSSY